MLQVHNYVSGTWKNDPNPTPVELKTGEFIEGGEFYKTINITTYHITYRYAGHGVIAYDYDVIERDWKPVTNVITTAAMGAATALLLMFTGGVGIPGYIFP
jgi:hypothetical protein